MQNRIVVDSQMIDRLVFLSSSPHSYVYSYSYSCSSSSSFSLVSPMSGYGLLRSFLIRNPNWRIELVAHWICTRVNSSLAFYYIYIFPLFLQLGEISVYTTTTELKMSQQLRFLSPRTFSRLHHRFAFISLPAFPLSVSHARTEVRFQSKFQSNNVVAASSDNVDPQKLQVRTTIPSSFDWGFSGTSSILFLAVMWWEGGIKSIFSCSDFSRCVRSKFWKNVHYCVCSLLSKCL
jgi:hypothetical protein